MEGIELAIICDEACERENDSDAVEGSTYVLGKVRKEKRGG